MASPRGQMYRLVEKQKKVCHLPETLECQGSYGVRLRGQISGLGDVRGHWICGRNGHYP